MLKNLSRAKFSKDNKHLSEEELQKKLLLNLMGIAGFILFLVLALFVFAPQIGFFFGLFSKHRNEEGYRPETKISIPVFSDLPKSVKDEEIKLSGYAQAGYTVILYVNGPETARTTASADGKFEFSGIKLNTGKNTVFAKSSDGKGSDSENTEMVFIEVDKNSPKIEEVSPKDGEVVRNLDKRVTVSGKINEKATISVNGKTAVQKPDFTFDFLLGVEEGSVKIKIEAVDEAGNKSEKEFTVKYERRSV